jgi:molybdopterin synthase sulfur carrier subunit
MQVLYFAWLRQKIGTAAEDVAPPPEVATVGDLMAWLRTRGPGHAEAFAEGAVIRCAVDQEHVRPDARLDGAREVAFFPPVTGG